MTKKREKGEGGADIGPGGLAGLESATYSDGQTLPAWYEPEAYAVWLFEFIRADLESMTAEQWRGVGADVWAFTRPELVEGEPWAANGPWTPPDVVRQLQNEACDGLRRLERGEPFELEKGIRWGLIAFGDDLVAWNRRGTFSDLFRAAVMVIFQQFWSQRRTCPHCGEYFLKVGKQKYCSRPCATRANWEAFKDRRPERDHHAEYVRRTQKRLGKRVKVARRKSR